MSDETHSGTAGGLLDFLTYAKDKGLLAGRTAEAYRSAASRILSIDGEDWAQTDLRSLDLDIQMDRFVRLQGTGFKPDTLGTYKSRLRSAVAEYLRYIDNPIAYRGPTPQRSDKSRTPSNTRTRKIKKDVVTESKEAGGVEPTAGGEPTNPRPNLIRYPFPLRSGEMAYFELPRDLSRAEAQRMNAFISSLAIDTYPELTSGRAGQT